MAKILHILWDAKLGGIQKLVLHLAKTQHARTGLEASVVLLKAEGELLKSFRDAGFPLYEMHIRSGYDLRRGPYHKLRELMGSFDLIHMHSFNPWVSLVAVRSSRPIVYTEHGNFGFGRKLRFTEKVNQLLQGFFLRKYTSLITYNSEFARKVAQARYRTSHRPSEVIYNGLILKTPISGQDNKGGFIIGTVSRLAGGKRISLLIDAFANINKAYPACRLWIVGDGPERKSLEAQARDIGLEREIIFHGSTTEPWNIQSSMDVCVFPFANESFGLVAIESLALGKPALVMEDSGGLQEIIRKVSPGDVCSDQKELEERIIYYYHNPEAIEERATLLREYAARFDIRVMEEAVYSAYSKLI